MSFGKGDVVVVRKEEGEAMETERELRWGQGASTGGWGVRRMWMG